MLHRLCGASSPVEMFNQIENAFGRLIWCLSSGNVLIETSETLPPNIGVSVPEFTKNISVNIVTLKWYRDSGLTFACRFHMAIEMEYYRPWLKSSSHPVPSFRSDSTLISPLREFSSSRLALFNPLTRICNHWFDYLVSFNKIEMSNGTG